MTSLSGTDNRQLSYAATGLHILRLSRRPMAVFSLEIQSGRRGARAAEMLSDSCLALASRNTRLNASDTGSGDLDVSAIPRS